MNENQANAADAVAYPIPADLGVQLVIDDDEVCVAHPQPAPGGQAAPPSLAMPRLHTSLLHPCAAMAQALWRESSRQMIFLFYLDVVYGTWRVIVPDQRYAANDVHCRLAAPDNPWGVTLNERLAGSLRSLHVDNPIHLPEEAPPFDGVHIFLDLAFDGGLCFWSYARAGDQVVLLAPDQVVQDAGAEWLKNSCAQLHLMADAADHQDEDDWLA